MLVYDVTDASSFEALEGWLGELRESCGGLGDLVVHVVGTKTDLLEREPGRREVGFERALGFVGEFLHPGVAGGGVGSPPISWAGAGAGAGAAASPASNRSSGYWGLESEALYTSCHEVSAANNEGIDEVFRIITQKLVLQHQRRLEHQRAAQEALMKTPGGMDGAEGGLGYFDLPNGGQGSFRLGANHAAGDKRKSWLGFPSTPGGATVWGDEGDVDVEGARGRGEGRCC